MVLAPHAQVLVLLRTPGTEGINERVGYLPTPILGQSWTGPVGSWRLLQLSREEADQTQGGDRSASLVTDRACSPMTLNSETALPSV